jgi:hypothetical protein
MGQRWLSEVQSLRRATEVQLAGEHPERLQTSKIRKAGHCASLLRLRRRSMLSIAIGSLRLADRDPMA